MGAIERIFPSQRKILKAITDFFDNPISELFVHSEAFLIENRFLKIVIEIKLVLITKKTLN